MKIKRFAYPILLAAVIVLGAAAQQLKHPYASDAPIAEPMIFGEGVISTQDFDDYFAFMPDGNTIYFTKHNVDFSGGTIVVSHFSNGKWTEPEIAPFSGQYNDGEPCISPDGNRLFFKSNRPVTGQTGQTPRRDADIWFVEKTATGWGEPQHLDAPINTDAYDWHPSVTRDGTLYFVSDRKAEKRANNIYRAPLINGKYTTVEMLPDEVNSDYHDMHAWISADEKVLLFVSDTRPDSFGQDDLYVSYNRNGQWSQAKNLGPKINTRFYEYSAKISPDGKYLFYCHGFGDVKLPDKKVSTQELNGIFNSARNGFANIYQIDLAAAGIER
jgi:Tol biopolymer transport system component